MTKTNKTMNWELRAVQLDLARQPETVEYIESFIDFAASCGFNSLVLYLEGRIKTGSFPFSKRAESYSPEQIRRIVDYAAAHGLDTIPVVSMFGHADIFLEGPELEELAELRGGRMGRFSGNRHVFCPSQPGTPAFLADYTAEVAELFPSRYFHAGFDEAWDIGYCDLCRGKNQAELFGAHLLRCYEIVTKRLGKQMMIWDDMFDIYPEVLETLPRDIILCAWQYDSPVEMPSGHCGGPRADKLALYDRMGFRYIFAPAVFSLRNIETLSSYASGRHPLGGLLTSWELERSFLFSDYPNIAYAGMLWNGANPAPEQAVRAITGCGDAEASLLCSILNNREARLSPNPQTYLRGPLNDREYDRKVLVSALRVMLEPLRENAVDELKRSVLEDLIICLDEELLSFELRRLLGELYAGSSHLPLDAAEKTLAKIREKRLSQWRHHRPGIDYSHLTKHFDQLHALFDRVRKEAGQAHGLLRIRFLFAQANISLSIKWQDQSNMQTVAAFRISHQPQDGAGQYLIPVPGDGIPEALRVESSGLTGIGITYLEFIDSRGVRHIPGAVLGTSGNVTEPEALLEDGADWCRLGEWEQNARVKFIHPELAEIRHGVEIALQPDILTVKPEPKEK